MQAEQESLGTENTEAIYEIYKEYTSTGTVGAHIYVDLDEDGMEELFIWRPNSTRQISTISEGKAVTVMAANDIFLCDGGIFGLYGEDDDSGTVFYYKMENHKAVLVDAITTTFRDDAWYRSTDSNLVLASAENMTRITKEEAQKVCEQYAISEANIPEQYGYLTWLYGEEE